MYPGGKNASYHHYINLMPPHKVYIELFLGSGAIIRRKKKAELLNVGVELDGAAIETFHALDFDPLAAQADAVQVYHMDVLSYLKIIKASSRQTMIFCDPPYLFSARSSNRRIYAHEFGEESEHQILLKALKELSCMVMLCGYPSQLYDEELADWHCYSYEAVTRGGTMMTECIWTNYDPPTLLHDYRFIGADFREREVHAKRIRTILRRWQRWTSLERAAYFAALQESGLV